MHAIKTIGIVLLVVIPAVALVGVAYATDFTWNSSSNDVWDDSANWQPDTGFPQDGDDATQDDSFFSRIDVDGDERCDNLTGHGGAANDRFVLVKAQKKLEVDLNLVESGSASRYRVRMQNGASGALTTVDVGLNDGDADVDLLDWRYFQIAFSGAP